ncbi:hypothetical protein BCR42DRAFT_456699 [Absidia repens]|uniref:2',3'-cyclic-nucleotide 3'-phosphodiesterase n=1 Tax=Absidia repens TaxID=90262 RepID=A0A1X2HZ53_9FUNG|nr:hypothetical protein BCR42DRAFT_456699 [Absidia repens]
MRELILYLEPTRNTPLRQCLDSILSNIASSYHPSTALKYPIHVSVTGFFTVDTQADVAFITDTYSQILSSEKQQQRSSAHCQLPNIDLKPIIVSTPHPHNDTHDSLYSTKHLLLPVTVPDDYQLLLAECADHINKHYSSDGDGSRQQQQQQQKFRRIRPKRMDHISLAYWDEPMATMKEANDWLQWSHGPGIESMKQDIIQHLHEFQSAASSLAVTAAPWDMVLYERTHKGNDVGVKHVFQEWHRWHLMDLGNSYRRVGD